MHRPTYAEITSTLALFLALGGVSYAAATLPANSVSSATIRNGAVRSADVAPGSISASKLSKDLRTQLGVKPTGKGADGTSGVNGTHGSDGAAGAAGAAGAQGPAGTPGAAGAAGRDGAAIAARANFGSHTVSGTSFTKVGELTWTQPANAIDDIRGIYSAPKVEGCGINGGGVAYRILVDGIEVSQDWGNIAPDTTEYDHDKDPVIILPYANYHGVPDRGVFGAEIPILGGAQPTEHKLELLLRRKGACAALQISDLQVYVTRFAG